MSKESSLPELLAPAGSPEALAAAIEGGADAVYFGGSAFNARMFARNFAGQDLRDAVKLAHTYGVKSYITLNTLVTDRETPEALRAAAEYFDAGADALIVADLGLAAAIRKMMPQAELHASTQASGHCRAAADELCGLGFTRMVMAREATLEDIRAFTGESKIELEVFVHGALCVSHSGQCLFSSLVGGRSGNRGECAQPCRLPYGEKGKEKYPLSLKDLSLASHVPELIDAGVNSLKLEGRMKPPEYVLAVTRVWRRLLDENRAATKDELEYLAGAFSRGGSFTDGYFVGRIGHGMLGVRTEKDKEASASLERFTGLTRKVSLDISAEFHVGEPARLTLSDGSRSVTVAGDAPQLALTAPMTAADYTRCLTKLGGTAYAPGKVEVIADDGLMVPVSRLNALRRRGLEALAETRDNVQVVGAPDECVPERLEDHRTREKTARFPDPSDVTDLARSFFDRIYLPLDKYDGSTDAVILPPVIFDRELDGVKRMLERAARLGATDALVGNVGHFAYARDAGLRIHGDFRLNIQNSGTARAVSQMGASDYILSPELSLPQQRDIWGNGATVVYGRIPLMLVEKCVIGEIAECPGRARAEGTPCSARLVDRRGTDFPVLREYGHRNVIYNSLPTNMSDRIGELDRAGIASWHFIFSVESRRRIDTVIEAFRHGLPLNGKVRRI